MSDKRFKKICWQRTRYRKNNREKPNRTARFLPKEEQPRNKRLVFGKAENRSTGAGCDEDELWEELYK